MIGGYLFGRFNAHQSTYIVVKAEINETLHVDIIKARPLHLPEDVRESISGKILNCGDNINILDCDQQQQKNNETVLIGIKHDF